MTLDPPLFPLRCWVGPPEREAAERAAAEAGRASVRYIGGTVDLLQHWVCGASFHQYGPSVLVALEEEHGAEEAVRILHEHPARILHEHPARLDLEGRLVDGAIRWLVSYQRAGDPDANGFHSGHSNVEDACYAALTMIEEHEREAYEEALVVGIA